MVVMAFRSSVCRSAGVVACRRRYCNPAGSGEGQGPRRQLVPPAMREGEWRSKLGVFAPESPRGTIIRLLQIPIDWSPGSFRRWWNRKKDDAQEVDQRYIPERHQILGSNLATAHFVVARGGAVRFRGSEDWVRRKDDYEYDLPRKYVPGLLLEAVDTSGMDLRYEGLVNFTNLQHLRWLRLAGNTHVDDWFLDRVSGLFHDTLWHLDISCTSVTERGLCALYRMSNLQTLKVHGLTTSCREFQLTCLMLEEAIPGLQVDGVTYLTLPEGPTSLKHPA